MDGNKAKKSRIDLINFDLSGKNKQSLAAIDQVTADFQQYIPKDGINN
jgi:hypothetical protein